MIETLALKHEQMGTGGKSLEDVERQSSAAEESKLADKEARTCKGLPVLETRLALSSLFSSSALSSMLSPPLRISGIGGSQNLVSFFFLMWSRQDHLDWDLAANPRRPSTHECREGARICACGGEGRAQRAPTTRYHGLEGAGWVSALLLRACCNPWCLSALG